MGHENLAFSKITANVMINHLDEVLPTRAVFIIIELIEHPETAKLILPQLIQKKK